MESPTILLANSILASFQATNAVSRAELKIFQDLIDKNDPILLQILSRQISETELSQIEFEIFQLLKHKHKPQNVTIPAKTIIDEMTSPLDNYLYERKKRNSSDDGVSLSIGDPIMIQIEEVHEHQTEDI